MVLVEELMVVVVVVVMETTMAVVTMSMVRGDEPASSLSTSSLSCATAWTKHRIDTRFI